ncbi:MAG: hypothetical protein LBI61_01130 [Puniceicoccales bacterium]|jgi:hypothetical protein|nr:hypothetical protein [Puniceicoccales bacterium]
MHHFSESMNIRKIANKNNSEQQKVTMPPVGSKGPSNQQPKVVPPAPKPSVQQPKSKVGDKDLENRKVTNDATTLGKLVAAWNELCFIVDNNFDYTGSWNEKGSFSASDGVALLLAVLGDLLPMLKDKEFASSVYNLVKMLGDIQCTHLYKEGLRGFLPMFVNLRNGEFATFLEKSATSSAMLPVSVPECTEQHAFAALNSVICEMDSILKNGTLNFQEKVRNLAAQLSILENACGSEKGKPTSSSIEMLKQIVSVAYYNLSECQKKQNFSDIVESTLPLLRNINDNSKSSIWSSNQFEMVGPMKRRREIDGDDIFANETGKGVNDRKRVNVGPVESGVFPVTKIGMLNVLTNQCATASTLLESIDARNSELGPDKSAEVLKLAQSLRKVLESYEKSHGGIVDMRSDIGDKDAPWQVEFYAIARLLHEDAENSPSEFRAKMNPSAVCDGFKKREMNLLRNLISELQMEVICENGTSRLNDAITIKPLDPVYVSGGRLPVPAYISNMFTVMRGAIASLEVAKEHVKDVKKRLAMLRSMLERIQKFVKTVPAEDNSIYRDVAVLLTAKIDQICAIFSSGVSDDKKAENLEKRFGELKRYADIYKEANRLAAKGLPGLAMAEEWGLLLEKLQFITRKAMEFLVMYEVSGDESLPLNLREGLCKNALTKFVAKSDNLCSCSEAQLKSLMKRKGEDFLGEIKKITSSFSITRGECAVKYGVSEFSYDAIFAHQFRRDAMLQRVKDWMSLFTPGRQLHDVAGDGNCWFYSLGLGIESWKSYGKPSYDTRLGKFVSNETQGLASADVIKTREDFGKYVDAKYVNSDDPATFRGESVVANGPDKLCITSVTGRRVLSADDYNRIVAERTMGTYVDPRGVYAYADYLKRPVVVLKSIGTGAEVFLGIPGYWSSNVQLRTTEAASQTLENVFGANRAAQFVIYFNANKKGWTTKDWPGYENIRVNMTFVEFINVLSKNAQTLFVAMPAIADTGDVDENVNKWGEKMKKTNNHFMGIVHPTVHAMITKDAKGPVRK